MKKQITFILAFLSGIQISFSQDSLSQLLNKYNTNNVPYISVEELAMPKNQAVILDAREPKEYQVSHIKDAIFVGFSEFDLENTKQLVGNKQQQIVIYCSLGIRSEDIAEKLSKAGYTNVFNLYGGIFEWKNKGFDVFDDTETKTEKIHGFSPEWSKWLLKGEKIYD
ncbi:rhodanese-like domain-containing protein [Formosa maritima]|uniref:Rhodanese-like domain-containing protein n=1 Tax=Formosa maritima TaxID=2592046 RepID=A0A5D0G2Z2_9FLAO|nr:rhodanese-like domain-containing protein [Formosa maritima]TYA53114.1 rhodanese-like domain-containing protein [Formosa maritima]